jgi:hypothetical protein
VWFLGGLKNTPQLPPGEHRTVGGSQRTLGHTSARDIGLTWLTTGPARVGGAARRYGFFGTSPHFVVRPQSLSKHRMPGLGVCGSSGASKTPLSCPLGSIVPSGGHKGHSATPPPRGIGLTWLTTGPARVGGAARRYGFFGTSHTSCGPQSLSKHRMPGLGVCGSSGASKTPLSCPLGSIVPSGGHKGHSATPRQGT